MPSLALRLLAFAVPLAALAVGPAFAADPAAGKVVYQANCTACHGERGDGRGPAAIALKPKPVDFTQATFWAGRTDEQLVASIKGGRPGTAMTPFTALSDAELQNVVAYLRTLGATTAE